MYKGVKKQMIIVIFLIFVALIVLGYLIDRRYICDDYILGPIVMGFGIAGLAVSFIALICLLIGVANLKTIDSRIEMYQEENIKIENQIEMCVEQYQQYETEIFTEVAPDSAITLVSLYPELKSDTLVAKQIETYIANNEKIKKLKEEKINGDVIRWWLYFGG